MKPTLVTLELPATLEHLHELKRVILKVVDDLKADVKMEAFVLHMEKNVMFLPTGFEYSGGPFRLNFKGSVDMPALVSLYEAAVEMCPPPLAEFIKKTVIVDEAKNTVSYTGGPVCVVP